MRRLFSWMKSWLRTPALLRLGLWALSSGGRALGQVSQKTLKRLISLVTLAGFVSAHTSGCAQETARQPEASGPDPTKRKEESSVSVADTESEQNVAFKRQSRELLMELRQQGIHDERVLAALSLVPRHLFVPELFKGSSYENGPLPIGKGQTISQPYIVAYMTESLDLKPEDRVLEVGTGSGYQAAVLSHLVKQVYSMEIIPELAEKAKKTLSHLGIENVHVRTGDGYKGWPEEAPFDAVIITAAPPEIPHELVDQLKVGGRLIAPVGKSEMQWLVKLVKNKDGRVDRETLLPVRFVPMIPANNPGGENANTAH